MGGSGRDYDKCVNTVKSVKYSKKKKRKTRYFEMMTKIQAEFFLNHTSEILLLFSRKIKTVLGRGLK